MTQADIQNFLQTTLFRSNTVRDLCEALVVFAGSMLVLWIVRVWALRRLRKIAARTTNQLDDILVEVFGKLILPILYVGSINFAARYLDLPKVANQTIVMLFKVVLIVQLVRLLMAVLTHLIQHSWLKTATSGSLASKSAIGLIRIVVWVIAGIFLIDNLGFDVNSIVAGLGIGGVAVALASQAILGDLFNYFVIVFDKPFVEGDFIVVDDLKGEIEKIGVKSTRIRSLDGEQLIISNTNLTASRVRNFKRMQKRRASFTLGIVYQTPVQTVRKIPGMIRSIIEATPNTTFDRVHFKSFGDSALVFEAVYFVNEADYNKYMDGQQAINLAVMEAFQKEKIEFAYPTQTVYNYGVAPAMSS